MKRLFYLLIFMSLGIFAHGQITVTNNNDSGAGSLRDAVASAAPGQTITFSTAGPIVLTTGEILIDKNLSIDGGAGGMTINANGSSRIFNITGAANTITLKNLELINGNAGGGFGGAIACGANLNASYCTFFGNIAENDGAIQIYGSITANFVSCNFINNTATSQAGALELGTGTYTLVNCLFKGNSSGTLGGAILAGANTTIINSTITENSATSEGGGIWVDGLGTNVSLYNNIIANNTASTNPDMVADVPLTAANNNLITNAAGSGITLGSNGNISGNPMFVSPGLDYHLQDNSPAVNAGNSAWLPADILDVNNNGNFGETLPVDIDNQPRIWACTPDMGAFENLSTTIQVTNTNDSGDGSLRAAIDCANNTPGPNTITFNIPGGGLQTISPQSELPFLNDPGTHIDGTSQPGYNGTPLIYLNGNNAGGAVGLVVFGDNCQVSGLMIKNFQGQAFQILANTGMTISNNILTDNSGQQILGDNANGFNISNNIFNIDENGNATNSDIYAIHLQNGCNDVSIDNNTMGGLNNVNAQIVAIVGGSNDISITNNYIGTDQNNNDYGGNTGIYIANGCDNNYVHSNTIAYNQTGVSVLSDLNRVDENDFFCNSIKAIDLNEGQGNNGLQPPVITSAAPDLIEGTAPFDGFVCIYIQNDIGGCNAACQGIFQGYASIDSGTLTWSWTPPAPLADGEIVAVTLYANPTGNGFESSEYTCAAVSSFCVPGQPIVVTNTDDSGPGSLREAINCANDTPGANTILFDIPGGGVHTISPLSLLPTLNDDGTIIDGTSQPGYAGTPLIYINGSLAGPGNCLTIFGSDCQVNGLMIKHFDGDGISILGNNNAIINNNIITENTFSQISFADATNATVDNNILNIDENGVGSTSNSVGVWLQNDAEFIAITNNTIGGIGLTGESMIVILDGVNNLTITGNYLGTDQANNNYGGFRAIVISNTSTGYHLIRENTIAYNQVGITNGSNYTRILENDFFCNSDIAIDQFGVGNNGLQPPVITSAAPELITGTAPGMGEVCIYLQNDIGGCTAACQGFFEAFVATDGAGNWSWAPPVPLSGGQVVAATFLANLTGNGTESSEYSCGTVVDPCDPDLDMPVMSITEPEPTVECSAGLPPLLEGGVNIFATDECDGDISGDISWSFSDFNPMDCSNGGPVQTVVDHYIVTDANGNTAEITWTITVVDTEPPVWDDPGLSLTLNAECGDDIDALIAANIPTATDGCGVNPDPDVYVASATSGTTCGNAFTQHINYATADVCGNQNPDLYTVTIIVSDNIAPTFTSTPPPTITTLTDPGSCDATLSLSVTAEDICDTNVSITNDSQYANSNGADASGTYPPGVHVVTFTATDGCLNSDTYTVTVTVNEPGAPTITGVQSSATVECGDALPPDPIPGINLFATDGNGIDITGSIIVDLAMATQDCSVNGIIEERFYTISVMDICGTTTSESYTITIVDTQAPVWDNPAGSITLNLECGDDVDAALAANLPTATDACGVADIVPTTATSGIICGNASSATYNYAAVDNCGNTNPVFFQIFVNLNDTQDPVISGIPNDITINCGDPYPNVAQLLENLTATDVCEGDLTGQITLLGPPAVTGCSPVPGIIEDVYTISVMDGCGNSATEYFTIEIINDLVVDLGDDQVLCDGNPVVLDAGNPGASYEWSTGATTQTISVASPGTYSVTVYNGNGCCNVDQVNVTIGSDPDISAAGGTLDCNNNSIQLMSFSNTSGVTFSWTGPNNFSSNQQNPVITVPGTYTVTATSPQGCTATAEAVVDQNGDLPDASATGGTLDCNNSSVQLSGNSSTAGVSYSWSGPNNYMSTEQNPTVSTAGSYTLSVTASNGCVSLATATVVLDETAPDASATGGTLDCAVTSVQLMGSSTTQGASYSWSGPNNFMSSVQNPTASEAGTYTLTVTGPNGCTSTATATVDANADLPNASASGGTIDCNNTSVQLPGNSTTPGVTYGWTGPDNFVSSEQNPTVTGAGTYTLTVTAANGCASTATAVVIEDTDVPDVTATGGTLDCNASNIQLMSGSSVTGCTFSWTGPNNFISSEQNPSVTTAGTYTVTCTAPNGCSNTATATVEANADQPDASATGGTLDCDNASVQLTGSSTTTGVTYSWTGPNNFMSTEQNPSVSEPGNYLLTVTASNGCTTAITAVVDEDVEVPNVSATGGTIDCSTSNTQLTASSDAEDCSFSWTGPNNFMSSEQNPFVTVPGTYTVTCTTPNGCSATATATVQANADLPDATATGGTIDCNNSVVQLMGSSSTPGVTYSWVGPNNFTSTSQNPVVTAPGTYTLTVQGPNGCSAITTASVVIDNTFPTISATGGTLNCNTSNVQLMATSSIMGTTYSWTGPNNFMSSESSPFVTTPGVYSVTGTAPNGCSSVSTTQVIQDNTPPVATATGGTLNCNGTPVQLAGSSSISGSTFSWTGPDNFMSSEQNPTVSAAGNYILTVTAPNGCTGVATATVVLDNNVPTVSATGGMLDCNANDIQLMATSSIPGSTFSWSGPNNFMSSEQNPFVTTAGTYNLSATAPNGCTATASAIVSANANQPDITTAGGNLDCNNTPVQLMGSSNTPGVTYSWTGPGNFMSTQQNPSVSLTGVYTLTITAPNGCTAIDIAIVGVDNTAPVATATSGTINCNNNNVHLMATSSVAGSSFLWTGPNNFMSSEASPFVTAIGTYTVTVTGPNGCTATASTSVNLDNAAPAITAAGGTLDCNTPSVQLAATSNPAGSSFSWTGPNNFMSSEQNPTVFGVGTYNLTVTGSNGCTATASAVVDMDDTVTPVAGFTFTSDQLSVTFSDNSTNNPTSWSWDFGDGQLSTQQSPAHTYNAPGEYQVTLVATNDCGSNTYQETITVIVDGVNEVLWFNEFTLAPNPNNGRFTLNIKGQPVNALDFKLLNVLGQIEYSETLDMRTGNLNRVFEFNRLPSGIYFVRLAAEGKAYYHKVIIE
ncbi:MAG: PKD domain-containing protein [Lewinellaceae bacterium]|nr:PKD domain-containing protein [Lewinellaceae bacterium]